MPQTMRGVIEPEQVGRTLMHEHIFIVDPDVIENFETDWDEERAVADAIVRLEELADAGIDTIVDLTVVGLGRSIRRIERVARATRVQIVVATGIYAFVEVPRYFKYRSIDDMAAAFVHDIEVGISQTSIRAGILKCATDEAGVTPGVDKVLRAAARAQVQTGAPISTHTHSPTRRGLDQQRIFAEEGVDLGRVVIGHSGDSTDLDYLMALADAGSTLGMDRFGIDAFLGFEARIDTVVEMCRRGYADRMVLSHDTVCYVDSFGEGAQRQPGPNWHYLHISNDVIPALLQRGVTEEQVDQMMIVNPRRILTIG